MKKFRKLTIGMIGALLLSAGLYSCNNDDVAEVAEQTTETPVANRSFESAVSSMHIDNGLPTVSTNNILVFESRELLESVFNQMINDYDQYNENLDQQIPEDLTDDDLENYIVENNLDENNTLNNFENNLNFKSLRQIINEKEAIWLETQGEVWDINTDPDNHFIVSDFERTLLNEGSELIIKDSERRPVIFKYFEWGHIEISDLNTEILKEINQGNINNPQVLENMAASKSALKIFWKNKDGLITSSGCRKSGKKVNYYYYGGKQIKGFTSQNQGIFDNTLVAKTKGYQWKRGQWRNRKLWVHAGVSGLNRGDWKVNHNCVDVIDGSADWKDLKRYKIEYRLPNPNPISMYVTNNSVYSYHSEGGVSFFVDFYDYNAVQW